MAKENYQESEPRYHTSNVKRMIDELVQHLREDTSKFDEPKAQAMFETSAEVLLGLRKAFDDYETGSESAMNTQAGSKT
jgi:hypothetical protein